MNRVSLVMQLVTQLVTQPVTQPVTQVKRATGIVATPVAGPAALALP